ncbi:MAG TPA: ChaN family lipoprotein [Caldimonas sp.]|nr:ChaN family lipoprotein [Caldimonas sp.]
MPLPGLTAETARAGLRSARRGITRRACSLALAAMVAACAVRAPPEEPWESRLAGDAVVLLGEVHDNAAVHRLRLAVLERALARGWRPAIAMEQFDRERQPAIDEARRERPLDVEHLIDAGTGGHRSGWDWTRYAPVIALALRHDLPLVAADLSNADASRIVRGGDAAVFDAAARAVIGLDRPIPPAWLAAQEREVEEGHCHLLPPALLPAMARAQLTRDAVIAAAVRAHESNGIVLLAGNGHVRRDIGVPRWLGPALAPRVLSVGFVEEGGDVAREAVAYDAVVRVPPAAREDPCEGLRAHPPMSTGS